MPYGVVVFAAPRNSLSFIMSVDSSGIAPCAQTAPDLGGVPAKTQPWSGSRSEAAGVARRFGGKVINLGSGVA